MSSVTQTLFQMCSVSWISMSAQAPQSMCTCRSERLGAETEEEQAAAIRQQREELETVTPLNLKHIQPGFYVVF